MHALINAARPSRPPTAGIASINGFILSSNVWMVENFSYR